jgi:hypothetical protein
VIAASRVGSQTILAPSRAAISTASGFIPPTDAFRHSAPSTRTAPSIASVSTAARSAVGT